MSKAHILVVADTTEASDRLAKHLLPEAGYQVTLGDNFSPPPSCDVLVVDVTQIRGAPLAGLQAQRRMGSQAPALLCAPRLTEQMASEVFSLGVRGFIPKPVSDQTLLEEIDRFVTQIKQEQEQADLRRRLEDTQATLSRRLDEMRALSRIGRTIATQSDTDTMLAHIVEAAVFLAHANQGAIFLLDEQTGGLVLRAQQGLDERHATVIAHPSKDSDAMQVLRTGQPIMKGGEANHKIVTGYLVRALINVPIIIGRKVIGVLAVYNHTDQTFDQADQAVLSSLADYAAIALDKTRTIATQEARVNAALKAARLVGLHAETLRDPVDGLESQIDTLLAGSFGPLNEAQRDAVSRIRLAADRIKEIADLIRQALSEAEADV